MTSRIAINRRTFMAGAAGAFAASALPVRGFAASTPITGVVELFTSQGCSSCPPADSLLHTYAGRDDILALGYHVDYWDYLGWKDTLASAENTRRQHAYREALGNRSVYTPQAIVNGTRDMVGSRASEINATLGATGAMPLSVMIDKTSSMHLNISITGSGNIKNPEPANVTIAYFSSKTTVPVTRGENAGHELTYANAVRYFSTMGAWNGEDLAMKMPISEINKQKADGCAILVQKANGNGLPGTILGAAKFVAMTG